MSRIVRARARVRVHTMADVRILLFLLGYCLFLGQAFGVFLFVGLCLQTHISGSNPITYSHIARIARDFNGARTHTHTHADRQGWWRW